jgi:hypothetical protein
MTAEIRRYPLKQYQTNVQTLYKRYGVEFSFLRQCGRSKKTMTFLIALAADQNLHDTLQLGGNVQTSSSTTSCQGRFSAYGDASGFHRLEDGESS